jgi:hypothetical protein
MDPRLAADSALGFWLLAGLHLVGVASIFLARLPRASRRQEELFQRLFLACLVAVGLVTMFTIVAQHSFWVWSGTTFSAMAVGATLDLGSAPRTTGF